MSKTKKLPKWTLDDTPEDADWIKGRTWDLPPYLSQDFFMIVPPDRLDWFRTTVAYKSAVANGLIHDDEWVGDYVTFPNNKDQR